MKCTEEMNSFFDKFIFISSQIKKNSKNETKNKFIAEMSSISKVKIMAIQEDRNNAKKLK